MSATKVLLVDDHALFRSGMRRLLDFYDDFEVVGEAGSAEDAFNLLADTTPDVILMDIDMPGIGGVAATDTIRSLYPNCRVLLLTGYQRYAVAGIQAGASGYILKDADEAIVIDAIRAVAAGGVYLQPEIQLAVAGALQQSTPVSLSEREVAIIRLVADGASNREIGVQLGLSEPRIKQHIADIFAKLGANDRAHAVALAIRSGLL